MEEISTESSASQPSRSMPIVAASLLAALLAGGGVYAYQKNHAAQAQKDLQAQIDTLTTDLAAAKQAAATPAPTPTASPSAAVASSPTPQAEATYTNTKYGYSFGYSSSLKLTASVGDADNLAISQTADKVNVFPVTGTVANGAFYVSNPGISLTVAAIKGQFGATNPDNISVTAATVGGASGYKVAISGDSSVVSSFYFVENAAGTVLELTVPDGNPESTAILNSFLIIK